MIAISLGFHDVEEVRRLGGADIRACPSLYTITRKTFQSHLQSIARGARSNSVCMVHEAIGSVGIPIYLTFDDGASGAYDVIAEELETMNWRGHFFITTSWMGRSGFMNGKQIRDLHDRGHVIGSHTHTHPARMSSLAWEDLLKEWITSRAILSDVTGQDVSMASVANGYYSQKVGKTAAESGIRLLFNSEPTMTTHTQDGCRVFGRYAIKSRTPPAISGAIAAGNASPRWTQAALWQLRKAAKSIAGESYLKIREMVHSGGRPR